MGCYTVPLLAAIVHFSMRKKFPPKNTKYHSWLNQILVGGATFGVIDHLWNGELIFWGQNILMDLLLGVAITISIFAIWGGMIFYDKHKQINPLKITN